MSMAFPNIDLHNVNPMVAYATLTALGATAAAFWSQIKSFLSSLFTCFLISVEMDSELGDAVLWTLRRNAKEPFRGKLKYNWYNTYIRPRKAYGHVVFEQKSKGKILIVNGWIPVRFSTQGTSEGKGTTLEVSSSSSSGTFTLTTLRWALDVEDLLRESAQTRDSVVTNICTGTRFFVRRLGERGNSKTTEEGASALISFERRYLGFDFFKDLGVPSPEKPFGNLAYPPEVLKVVDICRLWIKSKPWYQERGIAWRMGMLFIGPPGTGKTSCARAMAQTLDLPVFILDLAEMTNSDLVNAWATVREHAPAMALLEDLDRIPMATSGKQGMLIRKKDNGDAPAPEKSGSDGDGGNPMNSMRFYQPLTLDCLLNCISGIEPSEGVVVVATANDASKLDPALGVPDKSGSSTRPGRLDFCVEFPVLDAGGRRMVAEKILGPDETAKVEDLVLAGEGETGAQFVKRVSDFALQDYWATQDAMLSKEKS